MNFWKNLYNNIVGQGVDDYKEGKKETTGIPEAITKTKDQDFREEQNRKLYGDQIDDYIRDKSGKETWYKREERLEDERYWEDYFKNTGLDPGSAKYPIRMGIQNNAPTQTIPGMAISTGKRAITELYGGQK